MSAFVRGGGVEVLVHMAGRHGPEEPRFEATKVCEGEGLYVAVGECGGLVCGVSASVCLCEGAEWRCWFTWQAGTGLRGHGLKQQSASVCLCEGAEWRRWFTRQADKGLRGHVSVDEAWEVVSGGKVSSQDQAYGFQTPFPFPVCPTPSPSSHPSGPGESVKTLSPPHPTTALHPALSSRTAPTRQALANLSVSVDVAREVVRVGGVGVLLSLLAHSNGFIAEAAAGALWNLSVADEYKTYIRRAGGIATLVDLMATTPPPALGLQGECVLERVTGALANLAVDDGCSAAIVERGGVAALVRVLVGCRHDLVLEQAARALANLAAHGDCNRNSAAVGAEPSAIPALVGLLQSPNESLKQEGAGALWNLSFDERNREAIAAAGGVEALVRLAQESCLPGAAEDTQERAAGALWGLSVSEANSEAIGRAGGVETLLSLAQSRKQEVQETATGALWNLAFNPSNAARILVNSGVPVMGAIIAASLPPSALSHFSSEPTSPSCSYSPSSTSTPRTTTTAHTSPSSTNPSRAPGAAGGRAAGGSAAGRASAAVATVGGFAWHELLPQSPPPPPARTLPLHPVLPNNRNFAAADPAAEAALHAVAAATAAGAGAAATTAAIRAALADADAAAIAAAARSPADGARWKASPMAGFMASLALAYMCDGSKDAEMVAAAEAVAPELEATGSATPGSAARNVPACTHTFTSPAAGPSNASGSGSGDLPPPMSAGFTRHLGARLAAADDAALMEFSQNCRIQEAGLLRCSAAEIARFVVMLRSPSPSLRACAAFALLQLTMPHARHTTHHINLLSEAGASRTIRATAAAATCPPMVRLLARALLKNLDLHARQEAKGKRLRL
ncbi:unnamed protein product [Closterium sp. Yama58-4]|nr:unnamed protein product [Closterium sp. Yama58-4]